jgi:tRNA (guanine37-N1)-methyltransferase
MITFHFVSIFPEAFASYLGESILKRAQAKKLVKFAFVNPRTFAAGPHKKVDDRPFGGGPGMVMMLQPIYRAVDSIKRRVVKAGKKQKARVILFSTRGKVFAQADARRLAKYQHLVFICGRYEGVDERVAEHVVDEELSLGDFILSGGELPALVVAEAVARHIPGVLGKQESLEETNGSFPSYTRPPTWKPKGARGTGWAVPPVLISGDHKKVAEWRTKSSR